MLGWVVVGLGFWQKHFKAEYSSFQESLWGFDCRSFWVWRRPCFKSLSMLPKLSSNRKQNKLEASLSLAWHSSVPACWHLFWNYWNIECRPFLEPEQKGECPLLWFSSVSLPWEDTWRCCSGCNETGRTIKFSFIKIGGSGAGVVLYSICFLVY